MKNKSISPQKKQRIAKKIIKLSNKLKIGSADFIRFDYFEYLESKGIHLTPAHFYQPIPITSEIDWKKYSHLKPMTGIDFNEKSQLELLTQFKEFKKEYNQIPLNKTDIEYQFHFNNLAFDNLDAVVYYSMIRHFNPKLIIEIGSGWSTKIAAQACLKNEQTKLISIEPYPQKHLKDGFPGFSKLIPKRVENVDLKIFSELSKNDILFIDSSHTVKTGGDVVYEFLQILPQLKKGTIIHIHDIFFPYDYPKNWVKKEKRFWAEQYLVQALLTYSKGFRIIFANNYLCCNHLSKLKKTFPKIPNISGGSLWIQKIID